MKTISQDDLVINYYDSIEDLPASLHNEFNLSVLEDENIGSGIDAIKKHNQQIMDFLLMGNTEYALEQAKQQNFCITATKEKYSYKRQAFCHLIHSVNGREPISRTDNFLLDKIQSIGDEVINGIVNEVKKNFQVN